MVSSCDVFADLHTHTIFSKHAFSTLNENIKVAHRKGLKYLAVTDHYFWNSAGTADAVNENKNLLTRLMYANEVNDPTGMKIINGAEFNLNQILEPKMEKDKFNKQVLWRPLGLHKQFIFNKEYTTIKNEDKLPKYVGEINAFAWTTYDLYGLWMTALKSDYFVNPTAFCHIERELHKCKDSKNIPDFLYALVDAAIERDIYLELNESSVIKDNYEGNLERMEVWIPYAVEHGAKFYLGSDAHYCEDVGTFNNVLSLVNKFNIPKERILNCNEFKLSEFVKL